MTKKIVPFEISLKSTKRAGFTFQPRPQILTNDANAAELNFIITDTSSEELTNSTATVLLFMRDGSFFQNTDVTRVNNTFIYTIKPNQAKHSGVAQAQLVVKMGTVENASPLMEFEIVGGLETKPIVEREIQDWTSLTAEAKAFVEQIKDFTLEGFVENKMGEELANLEVNYATRLTGLEQKDNQLTAQLAQIPNQYRSKDVKITTNDIDKSTDASKIQLLDLSEGVQAAMAGTSPVISSVADGSITNAKYADESITAIKLSKGYNHKGRLSSTDDLNNIYETGTYYAIDCANRPTNDVFNVIVNFYDNRYVTQIAIKRNDPTQIYVRSRDNNYPAVNTTWQKINAGLVNGSQLKTDYNYKGAKSTEDLNTILDSGLYVFTGIPVNRPEEITSTVGGLLKVENHNNGAFVKQEYTDLNDIYKNIVYSRVIRPNYQEYGDWKSNTYNSNSNSNPNLPLSGKKMVMFGDSITEFSNFDEIIAQRTGMTVYNCGFGGCRMSRHNDVNYDVFSMTTIAESVASGDFTAQDTANIVTQFPTLDTLKSIDFNTIDCVSIGYGTNDFTGGIMLGALEDIATRDRFNGAIRLVIERLLTAYPHLKIFFITPLFRARQAPGDGLDSDNNNNGNWYLKEYSDTLIEVAKSRHLPVLNFHDESGFNIYNHTLYSDDGLHPNATGYEFLGNKIAAFVESRF